MRRLLLLVLFALAAGCASDGGSTTGAGPAGTEAVGDAVTATVAPPAPPAARARTVERVTDGDTLRLADGTRVRLLQIDAPEVAGTECYAARATAALERLTPPGTRVRLEADPALDRVDRYGRVLRYVRRGDVHVNLALVRAGAAAPYFYRGERGRYAHVLLAAAESARRRGRGLWGACPAARLDPDRALATGPG